MSYPQFNITLCRFPAPVIGIRNLKNFNKRWLRLKTTENFIIIDSVNFSYRLSEQYSCLVVDWSAIAAQASPSMQRNKKILCINFYKRQCASSEVKGYNLTSW
jgi:hypothetical protein